MITKNIKKIMNKMINCQLTSKINNKDLNITTERNRYIILFYYFFFTIHIYINLFSFTNYIILIKERYSNHMSWLTNQLISPLFHLGFIDYPDLGTPCRSKFPVPPSPKRFGKITKNFENAAKSSRPSFYIRQPKVKSVSSFISRYPKNSFYTFKEVTAC